MPKVYNLLHSGASIKCTTAHQAALTWMAIEEAGVDFQDMEFQENGRGITFHLRPEDLEEITDLSETIDHDRKTHKQAQAQYEQEMNERFAYVGQS